ARLPQPQPRHRHARRPPPLLPPTGRREAGGGVGAGATGTRKRRRPPRRVRLSSSASEWIRQHLADRRRNERLGQARRGQARPLSPVDRSRLSIERYTVTTLALRLVRAVS